ncbi:adult cuticle protein 1-like [Culicoides brevitarsis]|uniref:adult cuticle protein 1-like n=1 Tax=Culicoides brevitarsis TaxID=469753 RepID=UPI00307BCE34
MKFLVVLMALAVAVQSSVIPYPYGVVGAPHVVAAGWPWAAPITQYSHIGPYAVAPAVTVAKHVPAAVQVVATHHGVVHAPVVAAHAPAVVVAPAPAASYTAATRGAVHQAPLEGHAVSQTSLNLAPAPGTV